VTFLIHYFCIFLLFVVSVVELAFTPLPARHWHTHFYLFWFFSSVFLQATTNGRDFIQYQRSTSIWRPTHMEWTRTRTAAPVFAPIFAPQFSMHTPPHHLSSAMHAFTIHHIIPRLRMIPSFCYRSIIRLPLSLSIPSASRPDSAYLIIHHKHKSKLTGHRCALRSSNRGCCQPFCASLVFFFILGFHRSRSSSPVHSHLGFLVVCTFIPYFPSNLSVPSPLHRS